ncbi:MAG: cytochrome c oxidase subunit II [Hyphomicrobiales bacterium]
MGLVFVWGGHRVGGLRFVWPSDFLMTAHDTPPRRRLTIGPDGGPGSLRGMTIGGLFPRGMIAVAIAMATAPGSIAYAGQISGPRPWQMNFQLAATPVMERIEGFHSFLLYIICAIVLFVLALLLFVMFRFNARKNPKPSRTTHNTAVEIIWTVIPILILLTIAIPSFRLLYYERDIPKAAMTVKTTGNQWYWSYEYPETDELSFDSILLDGDALQERRRIDPDAPRLLTTDNPVVVPVDTTVRMIVTASDVIHSWAMPSFGLKIDAIPGRINESWFHASQTGTYYGQCSELCGQGHAYMPIEVRVVGKQDFASWRSQALKQGVEQANEALFARLNRERQGDLIAVAVPERTAWPAENASSSAERSIDRR